ncbi:MarR family winged helix-turn-helix transcriptional regulator [Pseudoclavibacter sp. VKM Ac-2867]|mgnify:CR=1 FL=1|uniref:MarR family winged helix-turn-helix transcriptional regulator n=1 Tax=Pseudoclavibacter sp. VKM Ac-2867 TaxID=2783829 RepID=UPI00188BED8C|nr:MarR family winged helix-turn-helix transcriptional regulator [Pseudoclavibacter sp. VKM Ac-2867]MBF4460103.1 winged helix-turn-helix transcriptional regulator [Pseudoclavibacter sp. VKM Ac-2867]
MPRQDHERSELLAQATALDAVFRDAALRTFLPPLLDLDLTVQQLKVLTVLVTTEDGTTGARLAGMFDVSMASMSKLLDRLEARDMVSRNEDPDDARAKRVRATDTGRSAMRSLVVTRPEFGDGILADLELGDLRAFVRGMTAISDALAARAGRAHQGADASE